MIVGRFLSNFDWDLIFFLSVVESHPETAPSLRIDKPFSALVNYAMSIDFENLDTTDHGHIPYIVILVRVLEEWKKAVGYIVSILLPWINLILNKAQWISSIHICWETRVQEDHS